MADLQHETPERPDGFPSQTAAAQQAAGTVSISPTLLGEQPDARNASQPAPEEPVPAVPPVLGENGVDVTEDEQAQRDAAWAKVTPDGWTVSTLKGVTVNSRQYSIGTVLDPELVKANFTPWIMQKLVNAGVMNHPLLATQSPVSADVWSVLGLPTSAEAGEPRTELGDPSPGEGDLPDEASDVQERDLQPEAGDREAPGEAAAESDPEAEAELIDPAAMTVAAVQTLVTQHPELRDDVRQAELRGRNRRQLLDWLAKQG